MGGKRQNTDRLDRAHHIIFTPQIRVEQVNYRITLQFDRDTLVEHMPAILVH
jgi:hypothetical protein